MKDVGMSTCNLITYITTATNASALITSIYGRQGSTSSRSLQGYILIYQYLYWNLTNNTGKFGTNIVVICNFLRNPENLYWNARRQLGGTELCLLDVHQLFTIHWLCTLKLMWHYSGFRLFDQHIYMHALYFNFWYCSVSFIYG